MHRRRAPGGERAAAVAPSADGQPARIEVVAIDPRIGAADLGRAVDANAVERMRFALSASGASLADIRPPLTPVLRSRLGRGAGPSFGFRFLAWDPTARCLQPLSPWEEAREVAGARSGGHVLVAAAASLGLPPVGAWPPRDALFWRGTTGLPPGGVLAAFATGKRAGGLICRRWAAEQHLLFRMARERSFWVGLNKPPPLGDPTPWSVEAMGKDAMQYFGWREEGIKREAVLVIRGGWDWQTMFKAVKPGYQLIMRHPNNNNLTAKDLLYRNLREAERRELARGRKPCVPVERVVPETYLTDDPEDCKRLEEAIRSSQGETWVRKVADVHIGQGITPVTALQPGDCSGAGQFRRRSKVIYQRRMEPLQVRGRPTSLRSYVLLASLEPLVLLFNHAAGHVYVAGREVMSSERSWYTQHHSFEAWTFERFASWMAEEHGQPGFVSNATIPQMKDAILSAVKAARQSFTSASEPGSGGPRRSWDTGHQLGALGHFDLWCIDFMYDSRLQMRMLEMTDSCLFKGYGEQEQVRQRLFMMKDSLQVSLAVQSRILQHQPISDLFDYESQPGIPVSAAGSFELLYSEVPGSEYDFHTALGRCDT